jgi:uncharacterized protein (DUF2249 family)
VIRAVVVLDLTERDADASARHRRIFSTLSSVDTGTLVRLIVDREAYFDDSMSSIAGLTCDFDVEVTGTNPHDVRRYAQLLGVFQAQRRNAEAGVPR